MVRVAAISQMKGCLWSDDGWRRDNILPASLAAFVRRLSSGYSAMTLLPPHEGRRIFCAPMMNGAGIIYCQHHWLPSWWLLRNDIVAASRRQPMMLAIYYPGPTHHRTATNPSSWISPQLSPVTVLILLITGQKNIDELNSNHAPYASRSRSNYHSSRVQKRSSSAIFRIAANHLPSSPEGHMGRPYNSREHMESPTG